MCPLQACVCVCRSRSLQPRYSFAPTNHVAVYGSIVHVAWLNSRMWCRFAELRRSLVGRESVASIAKRTYGSQTANRRGVYAFHPLKLRSYWTKIHQIFTRCIARSSQIFWNRDCDIPVHFGMPKRWMKMNRSISSIMPLKLVVMAMSLDRSEKKVRSIIYDQMSAI